MALFFLKFTYSYPAGTNNSNPRICKFFFKKTSWGELVETTEEDPQAFPANFSSSRMRFLVYVGGKIAYDNTPLTPAADLLSEALTGNPLPDWEYTTQPDGKAITQISVYLTPKYYDKNVTIEIIQKKPQVPWIRYDRIPNGGGLDYRGLIRTKVLPASAVRIHQVVDQPLPNRNFFTPISFISNFSASQGEGSGVWDIVPSLDGSVSLLENPMAYTRFDWSMAFRTLSIDLNPPGVPFTLIGVLTPSPSTAPAAGVLEATGAKTVESQKITYNYYSELSEVVERVKKSFSSYADTFQKDEADKKIPTTDLDHDGVVSIVDRTVELSRIPSSRIDSVESPSFFDTVGNEETFVEIFRKNGEKELAYLLTNFSIIGKPTVVQNMKGISYNSAKSAAFGIDIYDTEQDNVWLIVEFSDKKEDQSKLPITFDQSKYYTVFCKVIVPEWDVLQDYYSRKDLNKIWGVTNRTVDFIRARVYGQAKPLKNIISPKIFLVARTHYKESIFDLNTRSHAYIFKNEDHNDHVFEQKGKSSEESQNLVETLAKSDFEDRVLINVPTNDQSLCPVGFVQTDAYYETVPGYGIQVRGSHGVFFNSGDPNVSFGGIANRIFGELISPHVQFNPYYFNDILDGRDSALKTGSNIRIVSNMGFDKNVDDSTTPFYSSTSGLKALLGGNLSYIVETVTETAPEFPVPALIGFKGNKVTREEFVTFSELTGGKISNFNIHKWNESSFKPVEDFKLSNPKFTDIKPNTTLGNKSIQHNVQLDSYNSIVVKAETISAPTEDEEDTAVSSDIPGTIKVFNEGEEVLNTISHIYINITSISGSQRFDKNKVYPFVVFYDNLDSNENATEDNENSEDGLFSTFGYRNSKGKLIPRVYYLRKGENFLDVSDIEEVSEIRIVPAQGFEENVKTTFNVVVEEDATLYSPKDILNKKPIGHIKLKTGNQMFLVSAKHPTISHPTMVLGTMLESSNSKINYPSLFDYDTISIESNYRLDKFITGELQDLVAVGSATRSKYYLMGYMEDAQLFESSDGTMVILGWLYSQDGSGVITDKLAAIPVPLSFVSGGDSVFKITQFFKSNNTLTNSEFDTDDPDEGKFPFFYQEGMTNYIVNHSSSIQPIPRQRVGVCTIEKTKTNLLFASNEGNTGLRGFFDGSESFRWEEIPKEFMDEIFSHRDSKNNFIRPYRVACIKDSKGANILLFTLCKINSQDYSIVMKIIPYGSIMYAIDQKVNNLPINKNHEQIHVLRNYQPSLVVGNPKNFINIGSSTIYIGNTTKKEEQYRTLGDISDDYSTLIEGTSVIEHNLRNLQEIDASFDAKHGIIKVYFINNLGIRDCRISNTYGNTWYSLSSF